MYRNHYKLLCMRYYYTHTHTYTGQLVCLLFPVQDVDKPPAALNAQEGPPFEVSAPLYLDLLEQGEGAKPLERLELSGPCPDSIKPRRGREWLGRWRRRCPTTTGA